MMQSHFAVCNVKKKKKIHLPKAFKVTSPPLLQMVPQVLAATPPTLCGGVSGHPAPGAKSHI